VFILDCLAGYDMTDPRDAEKIAERVLPRLQHANSAVVLSAVKVGRVEGWRAGGRAALRRGFGSTGCVHAQGSSGSSRSSTAATGACSQAR
jgi:hypothetical protein